VPTRDDEAVTDTAKGNGIDATTVPMTLAISAEPVECLMCGYIPEVDGAIDTGGGESTVVRRYGEG